MYSKKYSYFTDYCPELNTYETVEIAYIEAKVIGSNTPQRKVLSGDCLDSDICNVGDRCPLFLQGKKMLG